jgi:hypothetical protein
MWAYFFHERLAKSSDLSLCDVGIFLIPYISYI